MVEVSNRSQRNLASAYLKPTLLTVGHAATCLLCFLFIYIAGQTHLTMTFDYVIAGGGTAGLVIANRLTENPTVTVAVVEPGPDMRDDPGVLDLNLAGVTYSPALDWNFNSTAQPQLGDRVIAHHAGKALGGTTVINGTHRGEAEHVSDS